MGESPSFLSTVGLIVNVFGLFKKAGFKLAPKQLVELEFEADEGAFEICAL